MLADILEADGSASSTTAPARTWCAASPAPSPARLDLTGKPARRHRRHRDRRSRLSRDRAPGAAAVVLLNNLFRDQLDRYGELDTIATHWRAALQRLPADDDGRRQRRRPDPGRDHRRHRRPPRRRSAWTTATRAILWTRCPTPPTPVLPPLRRRPRLRRALQSPTSAPGAARLRRRAPAARCRRARRSSWTASRRCDVDVSVAGMRRSAVAASGVPGLYNAYNALAAAAVARTLGVPAETIVRALARVPLGLRPDRAGRPTAVAR